MQGRNILHVVFAKRVLAFLALSAGAFTVFLYICVPWCMTLSRTRGNDLIPHEDSEWMWLLVLYFVFLCNLCLGVWEIADMANYRVPSVRFCKHIVNTLLTGPPVGYCLYRGIEWRSSGPGALTVCVVAATLSLLLLSADLEERLTQLSPCPVPSFNLIPSRRGDIRDITRAALFSTMFTLLFTYFTCSLFSLDELYRAGTVCFVVAVLKVSFDSLLVIVAMHPIGFEKLAPSALFGDINSAKFQIFNGNYFYAVQNFNLVFLLNTLNVNLSIEGISYADFLNSFDGAINILSHQMILAKQFKYVDTLYQSTALAPNSTSSPFGCSLSDFGFPLPVTSAFSAMSVTDSSISPSCPLQEKVSQIRPREFFLHRIFRSLALRDLCRLARVSPFRRALIYRNPIFLQQTMYTLCSFLDYHAAQVHLCTSWISVQSDRQNSRRSSRFFAVSTLGKIYRTIFSWFQNSHGALKSVSSDNSIGMDILTDATISGQDSSRGATAGERMSGNHCIRAQTTVRRLQAMRSKSVGASALATVLSVVSAISNPGFSTRHPSPPSPLSRREILDLVNAVDALSTLLVKSLKEDSTGQTYSFFPSSLCVLLNMSTAIGSYLETVNGASKSGAHSLKLSRKAKWIPGFKCGEIQLLLLSVEESIVRVIRTNAHVLKTMGSTSAAMPSTLQAEMVRLSAMM